MNYQAGALLSSSQGWQELAPSTLIPIDANWKRVNFALAGYGLVVPGTISDPVTATIDHSAQATCTITHSVKGA